MLLHNTLTPPAIFPDDSPRARRDDKLNSHLAADRSAYALKRVQNRVLELVFETGTTVGSELNDLYRDEAKKRGWKAVQFETPRKRAEELAKDGFLTAFESSPETVYVMNLAGMARLSEVQS